MSLSKKQRAVLYMRKNQSLFQCPVCQNEMKIDENGKVACKQNHSFDVAKQGYIHLMMKPVTSKYDKSLFEARKEIIDQMLYVQMYEVIVEKLKVLGEVVTVLDTGCGEGSHLAKIKEQFEQVNSELVCVGIDISKEGIMTAAKNYSDMIWTVGDLANSPYPKKSFDAILNILSPANYREFDRLLRKDGKVIKVVPQSHYLKELREVFFAQSEKENYSNVQTVERFKEHYRDVEVHRVTKTLDLAPQYVPLLAHMTPMGWHQKIEVEAEKLPVITIDLDILIGTKP